MSGMLWSPSPTTPLPVGGESRKGNLTYDLQVIMDIEAFSKSVFQFFVIE
jgi:hypothetical protein